jgi:hypothetical protein
MSEQKYNFGSPEVLRFFNLSEKDVHPSYRGEQVRKLVNRLSTADNFDYKNALINQGANPQSFDFLNDYIEFEHNWKTPTSLASINELTNLAQTKPNKIYSYNLKEGPLYRGTTLDVSPNVGEEITLSRFKSFSPDINIAGPFVNEGPPLDFSLSNERFKEQIALEKNKQKTLFQVQADSPGDFNYLITPGAGEPEVLARPGSKYLVEAKERFPFDQRRMTGDIDFIKLRQLYGIDPVGGAIQGGVNLVKENIPGATIGAAFSALNPEVAKAVEQNNYEKAALTTAQDVLLGAGTEAVANVAGKYVPMFSRVVTPAAQIAAPVAAGSALYMQGKPGSLTDVVTRKAAANPVPWLPSLKPNPKTDLGARAGRALTNEARYLYSQLLKGKLPYFGR